MLSWGISAIYDNIAPIFVAKYYSPADLGLYNRAQGYASMPSKQINGIIQSVTLPVLSKIQNDNEALTRNYRRMLRTTAFIVFPLMMLLSALARPLVITLITAKWEDCIILLQIICFSMMWYPIASINLSLLTVKGRSDLFLRLEIIKKIIGVSILIFALPYGLIIFCIGNIVFSMISLIIDTYYSGKLINMSFIKQMRDLLPILILSFVMFGIVHISNLYIDNMYLQILIGGILGGAVNLGGAFLFKFKELEDVKYMLKRKS